MYVKRLSEGAVSMGCPYDTAPTLSVGPKIRVTIAKKDETKI